MSLLGLFHEVAWLAAYLLDVFLHDFVHQLLFLGERLHVQGFGERRAKIYGLADYRLASLF